MVPFFLAPFFRMIFPGCLLLVVEGLLASLCRIRAVRFVIPVLSAAAFLVTMVGTIAVPGWEDPWDLASIMAGLGLLGSLLGLGLGALLHRFRRGETP